MIKVLACLASVCACACVCLSRQDLHSCFCFFCVCLCVLGGEETDDEDASSLDDSSFAVGGVYTADQMIFPACGIDLIWN